QSVRVVSFARRFRACMRLPIICPIKGAREAECTKITIDAFRGTKTVIRYTRVFQTCDDSARAADIACDTSCYVALQIEDPCSLQRGLVAIAPQHGSRLAVSKQRPNRKFAFRRLRRIAHDVVDATYHTGKRFVDWLIGQNGKHR